MLLILGKMNVFKIFKAFFRLWAIFEVARVQPQGHLWDLVCLQYVTHSSTRGNVGAEFHRFPGDMFALAVIESTQLAFMQCEENPN